MTLEGWLSTSVILLMALATAFFAAVRSGIGFGRLVRFQRHASPAPSTEHRIADLMAAGLLPLSECRRDHRACLRCMEVDHCLLHRLTELGLTPGVELRVVQETGGPMLVSVRGSRVALGRELTDKMWVEVCSPDDSHLSAAPNRNEIE